MAPRREGVVNCVGNPPRFPAVAPGDGEKLRCHACEPFEYRPADPRDNGLNDFLLNLAEVQRFSQSGQVPDIEVREVGSNPKLYELRLGGNNFVARGSQPDRLKRWCEVGLEHVRKRWGASGLPDRVRDLLKGADSVREKIGYLIFTQSLGVDCELVSGKERRRTFVRKVSDLLRNLSADFLFWFI